MNERNRRAGQDEEGDEANQVNQNASTFDYQPITLLFHFSRPLLSYLFDLESTLLSLSLSVSLGGPKKREKFRKCLGLPQRLSLLPIPLLSRLLLSPRAARPLIHFFWRSAHPFSLNIWRLLVTSSG